MKRLTSALALIVVLGSGLPSVLRATDAAPANGAPVPKADLSSPDWLASYLPAAILVLQPNQEEPVQKLFQEGLDRIRAVKQVRLDAFPGGQVPPKLIHRDELVYPAQKSADAGFWVLVSQSGRVVALFAAYSTDKTWSEYAAQTLAKSVYKPAQFNGRPVPALIPVRTWFEHSISIN